MRTRLLATALLIAISLTPQQSIHAAKPPKPPDAKKFDALATAAISAMKQRAAELNIGGVAVVAYAQERQSKAGPPEWPSSAA